MTKPYLALSIVAPSGQRIAQGLKTLEVRSWRPDQFPLKDLVIVENQTYLNNEGDEELGVCCGAGGFILFTHGRKMKLMLPVPPIEQMDIMPG